MIETETKQNGQSHQDRLIEFIAAQIEPMGYDLVHIEIHTHRTKILRVFIDKLNGSGVGLEDCVKVTKALDEPLDLVADVEAIFRGSYELEVSSPGVDRPLRTARDYDRFSGKEARIHLFRPLSVEESGNAAYHAKNSRQKNFLGTLKGVQGGSVVLSLSPGSGEGAGKGLKRASKQKASKQKAEAPAGHSVEVRIPLELISKANLEPRFDDLSEEDMKNAVELG